MADELLKVTELAAEIRVTTGRRDDAIRACRAAGHSLREIAQASGLSHTKVKYIIDRSTDPAPEALGET